MKKIKFYFLIAISCLAVFSQSYSQTKYKLIFYNCSNNEFGMIHDGINSGNISIYETDSRKEIEYKKDKWGLGEYHFTTDQSKVRIEIENIFKQKIDTILRLDNKYKDYKICEDKFKVFDLKTSVEKSIQANKNWTLTFSSLGCFHQDNESIELIYSKGKVLAIHKVNNKRKAKIRLTQSKINSLVLFEKKLKLMNRPNGGCTTSDYYEINSDIAKYEIKDSSCLWAGFYILKKDLNLK